MDASAEVILRAEKLCKIYSMGDIVVNALKDVDLELHRGELLVLLGASGSGKSTLLNILGGLDVPSTGRLLYAGKDLTKASDHELTVYRREHVGFVFQFYNLVSSLTARENVALVTDIARNPMKPEDALALVGLSARIDHFPSQLSGGEQQRVAIARAIAKRPDILLCDEPTGALDAKTGKLVLSVLNEVNRETGTTTAIITHNAAIGAIGDTVLRMSSGEIVERYTNNTRADVDSVEW
ncbi:MAG: ABC transporter ATP-binding protein [Pseudohongiella sp.]|nr:ABC transporter ATP-binding protein [Pseudohongiella sp.]MDO9522036.1 ABC transporter ATP-binding protein [Pseudohongiella sp.]